MFGLSLVRYGSFSVRVNFRSTISGLSSGRILVRSVRLILVGSLLPGLVGVHSIGRFVGYNGSRMRFMWCCMDL